MGAKRLPRGIRERLDLLLPGILTDARDAESGAIDAPSATLALAFVLRRDEPELAGMLTEEAFGIVLDSYVADAIRDGRIELPVQGRKRRVRRFYAVPVRGTKRHVRKALEDLTPEDFAALEKRYREQGLARLQQARALRGLRQELVSGGMQLEA